MVFAGKTLIGAHWYFLAVDNSIYIIVPSFGLAFTFGLLSTQEDRYIITES